MSSPTLVDLRQRKQEIRRQAHAARRAQSNKDELSRAICARFASLAEYGAAGTVAFYVHTQTEVRTRHYLPTALGHGKRIVVPYCIEDRLELFHLEHVDELSIGAFNVLEPRPELRQLARKRVAVEEVDLIVVPGVAFDQTGARMGHGLGFYDKLLEGARPDAVLIGLAFQCQIFPEVPVQSHDIFVDKVVTEAAIYVGHGRAAR